MFTFVIILERLAIVLGVIVLLTQVLLPLATDKPMFWLFRKKYRSVYSSKEKKDFDETVDYLREQKEKTAKMKADLDAEINEKVDTVNKLKDTASEEKPKDPQDKDQK